jgi:hypothetical protein
MNGGGNVYMVLLPVDSVPGELTVHSQRGADELNLCLV